CPPRELSVEAFPLLDRRIARRQPLPRRQGARASSIPNHRALCLFEVRPAPRRRRPNVGKDRGHHAGQQRHQSRSLTSPKPAEQDCRVNGLTAARLKRPPGPGWISKSAPPVRNKPPKTPSWGSPPRGWRPAVNAVLQVPIPDLLRNSTDGLGIWSPMAWALI